MACGAGRISVGDVGESCYCREKWIAPSESVVCGEVDGAVYEPKRAPGGNGFGPPANGATTPET
jgi:hypothetical protein